jgi:uncharacterized protein DUF6284
MDYNWLKPVDWLKPVLRSLRRLHVRKYVEGEPSPADLSAIEAEWPLIEAELAVLDAEVRILSALGGPSPLDWRRLRRAEHQVLAAHLRLTCPPATEMCEVAS